MKKNMAVFPKLQSLEVQELQKNAKKKKQNVKYCFLVNVF